MNAFLMRWSYQEFSLENATLTAIRHLKIQEDIVSAAKGLYISVP